MDDDFTRALQPLSERRAPLGTDESVIARVHPSSRVLIVPALLFIAASGAVSWGLVTVPESWMLVVLACAYGALVIVGVVLPALAWTSRRIILTSRRVLVRSGLFIRSEEEMLLARCSGVITRKNWLQALFRCADIQLSTIGPQSLTLRDVPYPRAFAEAIRELSDVTRFRAGGWPGIPNDPA